MPAPLPYAMLGGQVLPVEQVRVSPFDRGFLFGDGVYEVMPVYGGRLYRFEHHVARLKRSLDELRIPQPLDRDGWLALCARLVRANGGADMSVYLQVTRGAEFGRSHVPGGPLTPTVFAFAAPLPEYAPTMFTDGIACVTAEDIRWARCDIKTTALLGHVLLKWQAHDAGCTETIITRDGYALEGSSSTLHLIKDGRLVTPPDSTQILPGTTRDAIVELAARLDLPVDVRPVRSDELFSADEMWMGAALLGLKPVTKIDGRTIGTGKAGPVYARMQALFEATRVEFSTECPA